MKNKDAVLIVTAGAGFLIWHNSRKPKLNWVQNAFGFPYGINYTLQAYGKTFTGAKLMENTAVEVYTQGPYQLQVSSNGTDDIYFVLSNNGKVIYDYHVTSTV